MVEKEEKEPPKVNNGEKEGKQRIGRKERRKIIL